MPATILVTYKVLKNRHWLSSQLKNDKIWLVLKNIGKGNS